MRQQDSESNCGVYAVRNALFAMGIERTAAELEKVLGTTATDGTNIRRMLKYLATVENCDPVRIKEKRSDVALLKLEHALRAGRPVIISWTTEDPGDHWVAAVGMLGELFLIADSAEMELVMSFSVDEVQEKWDCGGFDGVVL